MGPGFCEWLSWKVLRVAHSMAELTLVTSSQIAAELTVRMAVWRKGVVAARIHPKFRSEEIRAKLAGGHPEALLLLYVGRLAREKRIQDLKPLLVRFPEARLELVGMGLHEGELKKPFQGSNAS